MIEILLLKKCFFELLEVNPVQVSLVHAEDKLTAWKAVKSMRQSDEETSLCLFFYFRFFFSLFGTSLLFFTKRWVI